MANHMVANRTVRDFFKILCTGKDTVIIRIAGGWGNQLFAYAFGVYLAQKHGVKVVHTYHDRILIGEKAFCIHQELEKAFNIDTETLFSDNYLQGRWGKLLYMLTKFKRKKYYELFYHTSDTEVFLGRIACGFFQNHVYADAVRPILLETVTPKHPLSPFSKGILRCIESEKNAVSLHVRRDDFEDTFYNIPSAQYFQQAWQQVSEKYPNARPFVFSMDQDWCRNNLDFLPNPVYVDSKGKAPDFEDIILMGKCTHNIITNSTYSWWGAYINQHPNKRVISPTPWLKNGTPEDELLPPDWHTIPVPF